MAKKHLTKKQQTFSITAPGATSVKLVGSFTHWEKNAIHLKQEPDGVWRVTAELPAGSHRYRFIVDGQWCDDPKCTTRVDNPYGSQDSVRQVA